MERWLRYAQLLKNMNWPARCVRTDRDRIGYWDQEVNGLYETVQKCSHWPKLTGNRISCSRYRSLSKTQPVWINHNAVSFAFASKNTKHLDLIFHYLLHNFHPEIHLMVGLVLILMCSTSLHRTGLSASQVQDSRSNNQVHMPHTPFHWIDLSIENYFFLSLLILRLCSVT